MLHQALQCPAVGLDVMNNPDGKSRPTTADDSLGNHQFAAVLFFEGHGVVQRDDGTLGLVV
jgi:hypothetical protein